MCSHKACIRHFNEGTSTLFSAADRHEVNVVGKRKQAHV